MIGTTFASYIRQKTKTDSITLPDSEILVLANVIKDDLAAEIVANTDEHYFDIELTRDLEADIRDYTQEDDVLKHIKYIAAKLDGTEWSYLTESDYAEFDKPLRENSTIKELYSARKPQFYISGRSYQLLTGDDITAVTDGLKVVAEIYPENISAGSLAASTDLSIPSSDTTHALPRQVHKHWAMKIVIEWKQSRDKPIPLTQQEQNVENDLQKVLVKLAPRNQVRAILATVPEDDGQGY